GHLGGLSLAAGVAVAGALQACGVSRVQVEWANGVVLDLRMISWILVERSGVNYRLAEPVLDRIDQPVVDVARSASAVPSRTELLAALLASLDAAFTE